MAKPPGNRCPNPAGPGPLRMGQTLLVRGTRNRQRRSCVEPPRLALRGSKKGWHRYDVSFEVSAEVCHCKQGAAYRWGRTARYHAAGVRSVIRSPEKAKT